MDRVRIDIQDHIARVTLTREDKLNAFDQKMIASVIDAAQTVADSDARVAVLSGEGRAFSAGLDVASFAGFAGQDPAEFLNPRTHGDCNDFQQVAMAWHNLPIPVIAALQGATFGAGLQMALGADIRIAAPDTRLSVMEMKWGLVPDMGGMILLPRLVRTDVMRRLIYTADPISADDGLALGLVTQVADDAKATALTLAAQIAGKSPSAIRAAKRLCALADSGAPAGDVLLAESREQADLIGGLQQMEAIAANLQKRSPNFG